MSTFELAPSQETEPRGAPVSEGLASTVLLDNARWFTSVRWFVVIFFCLIGLAGYVLPNAFVYLGFVPPTRWPLVLAALLAIANVVFILFLPRNDESGRLHAETHLWAQITADLLAVTALTHFVGSVETFISFTYLFHIALACIFFPRMKSLGVVCIAAIFYLGVVGLEIAGILHPRSMILDHQLLAHDNSALPPIFAVSGVLVWIVVWHLVSALSAKVRERDRQLDLANEQLRQADVEKNRQMLRTAHDLKAPFSGIESNIQILKLQHWEKIDESVRNLISRIQVRAQTLSERIRDILILGDLHAGEPEDGAPALTQLQEVFESVAEDLAEKAADRSVSLEMDVPSLTVRAGKKQLCILFSNLVANGISYSQEGGAVKVSARRSADSVCVSVSDDGIGIRDEALPHIFDEYYRSKEAARFNKLSTGLGLAIVKRIATNLGLLVRVSSELGEGTTFEVAIPLASEQIQEGG